MNALQDEIKKMIEQEIQSNLFKMTIYKQCIIENKLKNISYTEEIEKLEIKNQQIIEKYAKVQQP